jgi:hypothetical protein
VQCDDAAGEIVIAAPLEARLAHHAEQFFLVRVHADRFRKVPVALCVVRDQTPHQRQDLERVQVVGRPYRF